LATSAFIITPKLGVCEAGSSPSTVNPMHRSIATKAASTIRYTSVRAALGFAKPAERLFMPAQTFP